VKQIRLVAAIAGFLILPPMAKAQRSEDSWENLKGLLVGQKVQVVDQQLKSQDGVFISLSDEAIIYRVGQQESTTERADVLRVSSREHMGRAKKAAIGLAVGAAAGAATLAIINEREQPRPCSFFCFTNAQAAGIGIVLFAPVGAGVGALLPSGHSVIYRTARRQNQRQP